MNEDGYTLLRGAIPGEWLHALRTAFDAGVKPSDQWPVPRESHWRYALVDLNPTVQAMCRLPQVLAVVGGFIGDRFFIAQAQGREPLAGGGHQKLHRDLSAQRPGDTVVALAYLDDYGAHNGATRIVPASHRPTQGERPFDFNDESRSVQLCGNAGDMLVFDADLVHAASLNTTGARRRCVLITYFAEGLYTLHLQTAHLRSVQVDASERFDPPGTASQLAASGGVVRLP